MPLPAVRVFPHAAARRITVADFETHEPIQSASVAYRLVKWHNWMPPMPHSGRLDVWRWRLDASGSEQVWTGEASAPGIFELRTTCRWTVQWVTVPTVLGCCLYDTYAGIVEISAPGYGGVWFVDAGRREQPFMRGGRDEQIEMGQGETRVSLRRRDVREDAPGESSMEERS
ncbi:MAG: hypothetical protein AB1716_01385 [Planctomycetota bacterium]